jgi:transketolase
METIIRPHRTNLVDWAKNKPEVLVLSADLTSSCEADLFRDEYPERFFSMGMAEQNMMSFAGGLAREGFTPFIHTFGVFLTRRPYDQVAMSIAYPNLPVRLLGFLPGLTTPGGVTHQATDDIALMRALPNMTVLECGDATEVLGVLDAAQAVDGPVYVRMLRGNVPKLFSEPLVLGQPRQLTQGKDIALISSGVCTEEAMRAVAGLTSAGISVAHLHVSTIKPLGAAAILDFIESVSAGVIVLENHSIIGGLGSAVAELMAEAGLGKRLIRLGVRDVYAQGASKEFLMSSYGLDAAAVISAAGQLLGEELNVLPGPLALGSGGDDNHKVEDL